MRLFHACPLLIPFAGLLAAAACAPPDAGLDAALLTGGAEADVSAVLGQLVERPDAERISAELASSIETAAAPVERLSAEEAVPFSAIDTPAEPVELDAAGERGRPLRVGGLAGRFHSDRPGASSGASPGVLLGDWFNAGGEVIGHFRGRFQPLRPADLPPGLVGGGVFVARLWNQQDEPRGVLRGHYGLMRSGRGGFAGRWIDRGGGLVGFLRGTWREAPGADGGVLTGRWAALNICDEADGLADDDTLLALTAGTDMTALAEAAQLALAEAAALPDIDAASGAPAAADPEDDDLCFDPNAAHGLLRGRHWATPDDDPNTAPSGRFAGRWIDGPDGAARIAGRWRLLERDGEPATGAAPAARDASELDVAGEPRGEPRDRPRIHGVFHGVVLNARGDVIGSAHGLFGRGPHGVGVFRGRYFDLEENLMGLIHGRWLRADRQGGPFRGAWVGDEF